MVVVTPPGQSPPFAIITDTDHSGWVIIATAFGLSCVLICALIRVFVRIAISPPFGHDDTVLAAATVRLTTPKPIVCVRAYATSGICMRTIFNHFLCRIQRLRQGARISYFGEHVRRGKGELEWDVLRDFLINGFRRIMPASSSSWSHSIYRNAPSPFCYFD